MKNERAGAIARVGLAATILIAGSPALASGEQPQGSTYDNSASASDVLGITNVNTVLESQFVALDDREKLEQFAIENNFTQIDLSEMSRGGLAVDNEQIASWGKNPLEQFIVEGKTVLSAPSSPFNHRMGVEVQDVENLLEHDRSLEIGFNTVVPNKTNDLQEQWGTVLIPGENISVFVRSVGNPTSYRLFSTESLYGHPFKGYYLYFESNVHSVNNARSNGIESLDDTPIPEVTKVDDPFALDQINNPQTVLAEVIVLPNSEFEK